MRQLIVILIIFLGSIFLGLKIAEDPGFAFFSYKNWSMEMPLWFAILMGIAFFLIFYFIIKFCDSVDLSLYRFRNWLRLRRKYKSYSKTNRGLIELIEGNYRGAENYLLEGIPQSDAPLINYLAAAKAAHERGAFDKRDMYLRKAHDAAPHADIAIGLLQAQLLFEQGQLEQVLATLNHLRSIAPKHKVVLKLLERVYVHLGDWAALLTLLPLLRKTKVIDQTQVENFEKRIYCELLNAVENKNEKEVRAAWDTIPRKYQRDPSVIYCYAKQLIRYSDAAPELEVLIAKAVKKAWNKDLIKLYGQLETEQAAKQFAKAESWSKTYVNQATLLLTLGRLAMRSQLWGKARSYYEASLRLETNPETFVEYGKLLEMLGEPEAAMQSYRDGLVFKCRAGVVA